MFTLSIHPYDLLSGIDRPNNKTDTEYQMKKKKKKNTVLGGIVLAIKYFSMAVCVAVLCKQWHQIMICSFA